MAEFKNGGSGALAEIGGSPYAVPSLVGKTRTSMPTLAWRDSTNSYHEKVDSAVKYISPDLLS